MPRLPGAAALARGDIRIGAKHRAGCVTSAATSDACLTASQPCAPRNTNPSARASRSASSARTTPGRSSNPAPAGAMAAHVPPCPAPGRHQIAAGDHVEAAKSNPQPRIFRQRRARVAEAPLVSTTSRLPAARICATRSRACGSDALADVEHAEGVEDEAIEAGRSPRVDRTIGRRTAGSRAPPQAGGGRSRGGGQRPSGHSVA